MSTAEISDFADRGIEWGSLPPEPIRLALCDWLRKHGIDPNNVAVPGWIHRQIELRRVRYLGYVDDYFASWEPTPDDGDPTEIRFVQLEAPPLPFPDGLEAWIP